MKRHRLALIATGVAIASAAHAQSSVEIFGVVDVMGYRKQLAGESAVKRVDSSGMTTSFWGLRGTEDLGGGLRAQFELSSFMRPDTGAAGRSDTDAYFGRASWVSLQNDLGAVRLGRLTTPGWTNLIRYSAFGASSVFGPSFLHNYLPSATQPMMTGSGAADSAWNNAASYVTPDLAGFVGGVWYAPTESTTTGRRVGGSVLYTRGAFSSGLVLERIGGMSLNFSKPPVNVLMLRSDIVNWGVSYDFGVAKLFGQIIRTELRNASTSVDFDSYNVGAAAPFGVSRVLVSYGETRKSQSALPDQKRRTLSLGYEYALSRRTDLYSVAMNDRVTGLSSGTGFAMGMRHRF